MKGFVFNPEELVIPLGSTVVWINQDGAPHTATADDGHTFQSDLLARGQSFSVTPTELGEFSYFCELHGSAGGVGMAGKLRVVAAGEAPVVTAQLPVAAPVLPQATADPVVSLVEQHTVPDGAFPSIHQLLVDGPGVPIRQGFAVGLNSESQEMEHHVRLLVQSEAVGDMPGVRRHAEHVFNLVVGARGADFGDLDGDGRAQNAGDGFGLLENGEQAGYIRATRDAATAAGSAQDTTRRSRSTPITSAPPPTTCRPGPAKRAASRSSCPTSASSAAVDKPASRLLTLAKWLAVGNDANADGEISPIAGEGGALVAYQHAQFMAGLAAFPTPQPK